MNKQYNRLESLSQGRFRKLLRQHFNVSTQTTCAHHDQYLVIHNQRVATLLSKCCVAHPTNMTASAATVIMLPASPSHEGVAADTPEAAAGRIAEGAAEGIAEAASGRIAEGAAEGIAEAAAGRIAEGAAEGIAEGSADVSLTGPLQVPSSCRAS
jgi:hypothetical protein